MTDSPSTRTGRTRTVQDRWDAKRARRRAGRTARAEQRRLRAELATYTTPAERLELDAIVARHSPEDAAPVQRLVTATRRAA